MSWPFILSSALKRPFRAIIEEFELTSIKTHDLITLKNTISSIYSESIDDDLLSLLNKLYIDSRYPSDLGLLPDGKPDIDDAKRFYENARKIYVNVRSFIDR